MARQTTLPFSAEAKPRKTADAELKLMANLWPILETLTAAGRRRVLFVPERPPRREATLTAGETLEASGAGS